MAEILKILIGKNKFNDNITQFDQTIDQFLQRYYICELYAKEIQKLALYEENREQLRLHLTKLSGKILNLELIQKTIDNFNVAKLKPFSEKSNNINVKNIKSNISNNIFSHTKIDMIFQSKVIYNSGQNKKTARILRNEIVHSLNLSAIKEVKRRTSELFEIMDDFIKLFFKKIQN